VTARETLITALGLFFLVSFASAQAPPASNPPRPSLPDARKRTLPDAPGPTVHRFWDRKNVLLFSGVAAFRALDYASTRNMQARGREEILLPDDVVNNSAGFAALEAAGTATSVALAYGMHRWGHHKIERWVSIIHIGVAGFGDARNYLLDTKHAVVAATPQHR
jgi:hypothetical protein